MQTKILTKEMIQEILDTAPFYYIEGAHPEVCNVERVIEYANDLYHKNWSTDLPDSLQFSLGIGNLEEAKEMIKWCGEELFKVEIAI